MFGTDPQLNYVFRTFDSAADQNRCIEACPDDHRYCCERGAIIEQWPDDGNRWYWAVASYDRNGRLGLFSPIESFINGPSGPPGTPSQVSPVNEIVPGDSITLRWDLAHRQLDTYVEIQLDDGFVRLDGHTALTDASNTEVGPNRRIQRLTLTGLFFDDGREYRWRIRGRNGFAGGSVSPFTLPAIFKNGPSGPPVAPTLIGPSDGYISPTGGTTFEFTQDLRTYDWVWELARDPDFTDIVKQVRLDRDLDEPARGYRTYLSPEWGRQFFWRIVARNELGTAATAVRRYVNGAGERCARTEVGTGTMVHTGAAPHVDTCYDEIEGRYLLIDKARRYARNVHDHNGRMLQEPLDLAGIQTRDWRNASGSAYDVVWRNADNVWGNADEAQRNAIGAQVFTGMVYDYLNTQHDLNGFDNTGTAWVNFTEQSEVQEGDDTLCPFADGAAYSEIDSRVGYGIAGPKGWRVGGSLDVVAHEWGHGVTHHGSGLSRSKEAGALNEAFSDWMAVAVTDHYGRGNPWVIAEELISASGIGLRSLASPHTPGALNRPQPDTYLHDDYWFPGRGQSVESCTPFRSGCEPFPIGNNDGCGVHRNSGVPNKAFYLLAAGGTHNGVSVQGIGIQAAFRIAMHANRNYWKRHPTVAFPEFSADMIGAARDIAGEASLEQLQVQRAWEAVQVPIGPIPAPVATPTPLPCAGDCDGDRAVTIDEIVAAVRIGLGTQPVQACAPADTNRDGEVSVDEIVTAVRYAMDGCPTAPGTAENPRSSGTDVELAVLDTTGLRGATISIPVWLNTGQNAVGGLNFDLHFHPAVMSAPECRSGPAAADHSLETNLVDSQTLRVLLYAPDTFPPPMIGDGIVLYCDATLMRVAPIGTYTFVADRLTAAGTDASRLPSSVVRTGSVQIAPLPACAGGPVLDRALVKVRNPDDPGGDDSLLLKGQFPATGPIDPVTTGLGLHVTDPNGLTLFAHVVPPGLPAFRGAAGWSVSGRGTKWTYRDRDGMTAHGIARARVHVREGEVRVSITGKRGTFPVAANRLPVGVTVALGNGPCASAAFGTTECWHTGSAVSCR